MAGHTLLTTEQIEELKSDDVLVVMVDADIPCYSVGFSCENVASWHLVQKTVDNFMMKIIRECGATHFLGFLTDGAANYRNDDAVTFTYKGQRVSKKPKWYKKIREYLQNHWFCQVMHGIEADDALAIAQTYFNAHGIHNIMATLDKDLSQVVGRKYDWGSKGLFTVSEEEAHYNLCKQLIIGDLGTDNIPGLSHSAWKVRHATRIPSFRSEMRLPREPKMLASGKPSGRKMAHAKREGYVVIPPEKQTALREDLYGEERAFAMLDAWNPEEYMENILTEYVSAYQQDSEIIYDDAYQLGMERFNEVFSLVYMLRTVDEITNDAIVSLVPTPVAMQVLTEFDDDLDNPLDEFDDDGDF